MAVLQLSGDLFAAMVRGGFANLRANASVVDDLNVFPIPDGDTGENMCMTIEGGVSALESIESASLSFISESVARGMLLNARGNSGVILSQFFAGIAEGFSSLESADVRRVGEAYRKGVRRAYSAVLEPAEGTMLTVSREATEYACAHISELSTLESFFGDFLTELKKSLDRTPELLNVLKEAGVVDSGGAGLAYIADGMNSILSGKKLEQTDAPLRHSGNIDVSAFTADSVMQFGYCVEFLLQLQNAKTDAQGFDVGVITSFLSGVGNSVVAFKTGTMVKAHVHTMAPGSVLDFAQRYGEFLTLKIENMAVQHSTSIVEDRFREKAALKKRKHAVVAVAAGEGIKKIFSELGADVIVEGGQTMNPSSEDFIKAFDKADASEIFVLPNDSNVILAARQAAGLYQGADVRVVNSRTIGEGYAALSMIDYSLGSAGDIAAGLAEAMEGVETGLVSRSIRDAVMNGVAIRRGDYIGFTGKKVFSCAQDRVSAAFALAGGLEAGRRDVIIILSGKDAAEEEAETLKERLSQKYPDPEVIILEGGQEVYDFILIFE